MNPVEETNTGVVALLLDDIAPARLGTLLRGARKQRSLTRRDVAGRVGTSAADLRRFERGDAPVPPHLVAALAECYGEDLTAQFAAREPIQVDRRRIAVGAENATLRSSDDDEVLGTYVGIVARLRHAKPGEPIALRTDDLVALSTALGKDPEHVEARIVELLGCTPHEARSLHSELLRRKLVLPVAGLVTGLAVITGVGISVGAASASPSTTPATVTTSQPAHASSPATHHLAVPPTVVASTSIPPVVEPTTLAPTTEAPAAPTTQAPTTEAPSVEAPSTEAQTTEAPAPPPTTEAPAPSAPAVAPAAPAEKAPVIKTDHTPVGIPANETVTIIQP